MTNGQHAGFLAAVVSYCLYGGAYIVYRLFAVDRCNVAFFVLLRILFTAPILLFASFIAERKKFLLPGSWREVLALFCNGILLATSISTGVIAQDFLSASLFSVIMLADPIATLIISVLAGTEQRPNMRTAAGWAKVVALVLTLAGTIGLVLVSDNTSAVHLPSTRDCHITHSPVRFRIGIVLAMVSALVWGSYFVCQKLTLSEHYPVWKDRPALFLAWSGLFSLPVPVLVMPFLTLAFERETCFGTVGRWTVDRSAILALEYNTFISSITCTLLLVWSLARLTPSLVAMAFPSSVR